jgi:hypothetical protein
MTRNNAAILNHLDKGRALRVFEGAKATVSYVGEFELDSRQPWYAARAPETMLPFSLPKENTQKSSATVSVTPTQWSR